jgi:hypothetical protein
MEFALVTFTVNFSRAEVRQNLIFGLYTALYERDDALDMFVTNPNGAFNFSIERKANGNMDDWVTWLDSRTIRPNGQNSRIVTIRNEFNVGNQERGNEEYRAFINVIPEIAAGKAWTNEVSINLG